MRNIQVGKKTAVLNCGGAAILMAGAGWWLVLREPAARMPVGPRPPFIPPTVISSPTGPVYDAKGGKPLAVGDTLPPLDARGWLPGSVVWPHASAALTVVFVWNNVCPVSEMVVPELNRLRDRYAGASVSVIGTTAHGYADANAFVERNHLDWPNGFGVRAVSRAGTQIFLVDARGRILWHDAMFSTNASRPPATQPPDTTAAVGVPYTADAHLDISQRLCRGLAEAIDRSLAAAVH